MPKYEDKPDTGVLFWQENKKSENHPDATGHVISPNGIRRDLAAWLKTSKNGLEYLSLKLSEPRPRQPQRPQESPGQQKGVQTPRRAPEALESQSPPSWDSPGSGAVDEIRDRPAKPPTDLADLDDIDEENIPF